MAARLGATCRQARRAARPRIRQIDVATRAGVGEKTVTHFEAGRWWIRETDAIVGSYAELLGTTPEELWRAAIDRPG
jgi:hypothetical protein